MPIAAAPNNLRHAIPNVFMDVILRLQTQTLLIWINRPAGHFFFCETTHATSPTTTTSRRTGSQKPP